MRRYICMYVCMDVCMYVYKNVCMYINTEMYPCVCVCQCMTMTDRAQGGEGCRGVEGKGCVETGSPCIVCFYMYRHA